MLTYEELKNKPRELLAATSLKQDEFEALLVAFAKSYEEHYPADRTMEGQVRQRRKGGGNKPRLSDMADKLLFILVYEKTYPLQTMLGLQFGLSQGRVNTWMQRLTPILQQALASLDMTPERDGAAVPRSELALEGGADFVIDGTERRRQRPVDDQAQREAYSGKKNAHRQKPRVSQHPQPESGLSGSDPAGQKT
jgi:Helix-turn-helix of DDE superfamily endonuclease